MEEKKKNILKDWRIWLAIVVIIGIISIIVVTIINSNQIKNVNSNITSKYGKIGEKIDLTNGMKNELYEKVKKNITDSLKAPSTAVFPQMKEWKIDVNYNNIIEVESYVDSQNSYGAMLRTKFEHRYILYKGEYFCIYKEFNGEKKFDITEKTEYNKFINEEVLDSQMEDFIEKSKNATSYGRMKDYNYNKDNQTLELNIEVFKIDSPYYKIENYINKIIAAYIDQCICIPTITTNLKIYDGEECVAKVENINFEFLLNNWYTLLNLGTVYTDVTNLEEKLQEKLWIKSQEE